MTYNMSVYIKGTGQNFCSYILRIRQTEGGGPRTAVLTSCFLSVNIFYYIMLLYHIGCKSGQRPVAFSVKAIYEGYYKNQNMYGGGDNNIMNYFIMFNFKHLPTSCYGVGVVGLTSGTSCSSSCILL